MTTNVTTLNRVMTRRCLVYMGNSDGLISYGVGKGIDYGASFEKAILNAKKNLIAISVDPF